MGAAIDELSLCPDPRKLTAQEKNLLRIRNLEREKQEGWEVMHAPGRSVGPGDHDAPARPRRHPLEAGDPGGWGHRCVCSLQPEISSSRLTGPQAEPIS